MGIDQEMGNWMRQVYELLARNRESAFSSEELWQAVLGNSPEETKLRKFSRALDAMAEVRAVEKRWVGDKDYYAFLQEFDTNTWEPDLSSHRV
jgi:hypothetical protein